MTFNKYIHPRNIYRKPPDFQQLAIKYPDFQKHVKIGLNGEATLDFENPEALRVLTKTLLKNDFNLEINIPEHRLIPTMTLRLNYILWIEDLLKLAPQQQPHIIGLDIGTGPCAIYPMMSCRLHPDWRFLATDINSESLSHAEANITANGLGEYIKLIQVPPDTLILGIPDVEPPLDFTIINPPFYHGKEKPDRTPRRDPPRAHQVMINDEKIMEGGEEAFFNKLLAESLQLKSNVRIYTTMLGKKSSLLAAKKELRKHEPELSFTTTEFCQGKTVRWGVAWTFHSAIPLKKAFRIKHKPQHPLEYTLPQVEGKPYSVEAILETISSLLTEIQVHYEIHSKTQNSADFTMKSRTNTWSKQRQKRRMQMRLQKEMEAATTAANDISMSEESPQKEGQKESSVKRPREEETEEASSPPKKKVRVCDDELDDDTTDYLLYCDVKLRRVNKNLLLKMTSRDEYNPSREAMHQVLTFLKNRIH